MKTMQLPCPSECSTDTRLFGVGLLKVTVKTLLSIWKVVHFILRCPAWGWSYIDDRWKAFVLVVYNWLDSFCELLHLIDQSDLICREHLSCFI